MSSYTEHGTILEELEVLYHMTGFRLHLLAED